jgi:hypothetical protein
MVTEFVVDAQGNLQQAGRHLLRSCTINGEPEETDNLWSIDSRKEMEYRLNSLQSLVCDLLRTNQELRDAVFDADGNAEPRSRNIPR